MKSRFCALALGLWGLLLPLSALQGSESGLVWEHTKINHTAKPEDTGFNASFPFKAVGKAVTIKSIRSSCGCTTAKLEKRSYEAGEGGEITLIFEFEGRVGDQRKVVEILTDDTDQPRVQLELEVHIPQIMKMEPRFLYWSKSQTPYERQSIQVSFNAESEIGVARVSADTPQLEVSWSKLEGERAYRIDMLPIVPEGELPFFRSVIKIEIAADFELKQSVYYAYAFMKSE